MSMVKINSIADNKEYQMIEGILYKFKQEEMAERKDDEKRRLVVPTKFRHNLLQFQILGTFGNKTHIL
jgi:hypothetical protein